MPDDPTLYSRPTQGIQEDSQHNLDHIACEFKNIAIEKVSLNCRIFPGALTLPSIELSRGCHNFQVASDY
jgi:hypothetical protein